MPWTTREKTRAPEWWAQQCCADNTDRPKCNGHIDWPLLIADAAMGSVDIVDFQVIDSIENKGIHSKTEIAKALSITRPTLYTRIRKLSKYFTL